MKHGRVGVWRFYRWVWIPVISLLPALAGGIVAASQAGREAGGAAAVAVTEMLALPSSLVPCSPEVVVGDWEILGQEEDGLDGEAELAGSGKGGLRVKEEVEEEEEDGGRELRLSGRIQLRNGERFCIYETITGRRWWLEPGKINRRAGLGLRRSGGDWVVMDLREGLRYEVGAGGELRLMGEAALGEVIYE